MNTLFKAVAFAGALVVVGSGAEAETVLKFSHPYTEQDTRQKLAELISSEMDKRTNGEVKIEIYPNQQLFKAKQQYEGLRSNQIDFAIYPMPWLSGKVPLANVGVLPGVIESPASSLAWRGTPAWDMLTEAVKTSGVHMASIFWDPASYAGKGEAPRTPQDLKGIKVRGMGKPLEEMMAAYDATIVSMPAADTYLAVQTGTIDALYSTLASFNGYRMHEVVDYIADTGSYLAGGHFILMGDGAHKALGAEHLKVLDEVMADAEAQFAVWAEEDAREVYEEFDKKGVKVVALTDEEMAAWEDAAKQEAWTSFTKSTKGAEELLSAIEAAQTQN